VIGAKTYSGTAQGELMDVMNTINARTVSTAKAPEHEPAESQLSPALSSAEEAASPPTSPGLLSHTEAASPTSPQRPAVDVPSSPSAGRSQADEAASTPTSPALPAAGLADEELAEAAPAAEVLKSPSPGAASPGAASPGAASPNNPDLGEAEEVSTATAPGEKPVEPALQEDAALANARRLLANLQKQQPRPALAKRRLDFEPTALGSIPEDEPAVPQRPRTAVTAVPGHSGRAEQKEAGPGTAAPKTPRSHERNVPEVKSPSSNTKPDAWFDDVLERARKHPSHAGPGGAAPAVDAKERDWNLDPDGRMDSVVPPVREKRPPASYSAVLPDHLKRSLEGDTRRDMAEQSGNTGVHQPLPEYLKESLD
jgi:hypothetical protein